MVGCEGAEAFVLVDRVGWTEFDRMGLLFVTTISEILKVSVTRAVVAR